MNKRPSAATVFVTVLVCLIIGTFVGFATTGTSGFAVAVRGLDARNAPGAPMTSRVVVESRVQRRARRSDKTCRCSKSRVPYYSFDFPASCVRHQPCACSRRYGDEYRCDEAGFYTCGKIRKPRKVVPVSKYDSRCREVGPRRTAYIPKDLIPQA